MVVQILPKTVLDRKNDSEIVSNPAWNAAGIVHFCFEQFGKNSPDAAKMMAKSAFSENGASNLEIRTNTLPIGSKIGTSVR